MVYTLAERIERAAKGEGSAPSLEDITAFLKARGYAVVQYETHYRNYVKITGSRLVRDTKPRKGLQWNAYSPSRDVFSPWFRLNTSAYAHGQSDEPASRYYGEQTTVSALCEDIVKSREWARLKGEV